MLILEDTDGDGKADKTTVFADGLMIPTSLELAPTDGGTRSRASPATDASVEIDSVSIDIGTRAGARGPAGAGPSACYVGEGTELWLLTEGDGECDQREVLFRGFGTGDNHQNINSFRWSPGGELMFSQGAARRGGGCVGRTFNVQRRRQTRHPMRRRTLR